MSGCTFKKLGELRRRRTCDPRHPVLPVGGVRLQPARAHLQLAPQREGHARRPVVVGDEVRRRRPRRGGRDGGDGGGGRDGSGRLGWGRDRSGRRLGLGRRGCDRRELLRRRRGAGAAGLRHGLRRGRSRARLVLRRALERPCFPSGIAPTGERSEVVLELVQQGSVRRAAARRREDRRGGGEGEHERREPHFCRGVRDSFAPERGRAKFSASRCLFERGRSPGDP